MIDEEERRPPPSPPPPRHASASPGRCYLTQLGDLDAITLHLFLLEYEVLSTKVLVTINEIYLKNKSNNVAPIRAGLAGGKEGYYLPGQIINSV